jgi:hypothetical protein
MAGRREGSTLAYLLRGWVERPEPDDPRESAGPWRFSLEDPHTGARFGFASLGELVSALEGRITNALPSVPKRTAHAETESSEVQGPCKGEG